MSTGKYEWRSPRILLEWTFSTDTRGRNSLPKFSVFGLESVFSSLFSTFGSQLWRSCLGYRNAIGCIRRVLNASLINWKAGRFLTSTAVSITDSAGKKRLDLKQFSTLTGKAIPSAPIEMAKRFLFLVTLTDHAHLAAYSVCDLGNGGWRMLAWGICW